MSAISGSGDGTQGIFQYLQSLGGSPSTSQTASTAGATTGGDASAALQGIAGGPHHRGGGKGGGDSFFSQIQSAVASALQSAQSSGANSDPNEVIQSAIAQVFKNQQNITSGTTSQASATDTDGNGDTDSAGTAENGGVMAKSAFAQLLQSNGVDPEQFHSDFLAAIQSAQNGGSADSSSVFSAFPTGSAVDTIA